MRIVVTGATGMVGRNLLAHASAAGHTLLTPSRAELNLLDAAQCRAYFADSRADALIHLAAVVGGIQANIDEPVRFLADNLHITLNVFEAARAASVQQIFNVASSCMYPRNVSGVLSIDLLLSAPLEPTNEGYALAKISSWKLLEYMQRETPDARYRTLAPCNLYGLYDHFDPLKSHLVPAAIRKVVEAHDRGIDTVDIWGDGTARREFMFSADLADFLWWALPQIGDLPPMLNVGVGQDHSVRDYYETIADIVGYRGSFRYDPSKPAGMARKLLDVGVQMSLGWAPPTSLREGLSQTINYYRATRTEPAGKP